MSAMISVTAHASWTVRTESGSGYTSKFESFRKGSSILVAAPHGTFDHNTALITRNLCKKVNKWDCVITVASQTSGDRINVNRPSAGSGQTCDKEELSKNARLVYSVYHQEVGMRTRKHPSNFVFFEVHGFTTKLASGKTGRIDVGTHNLTLTEAKELKKRLVDIAKAMPSSSGYSKVDIRVEGIDSLEMTGGCTKRIGAMALARKAVHFEFSKELRSNGREDDTVEYLRKVITSVGPYLGAK